MVDLMMWLVIAALLLAAAIQSIGYYQQSATLNNMKNDALHAGQAALARMSTTNGVTTDSVVADATTDTAKTSGIDTNADPGASDANGFVIRSTSPTVGYDVLYLSDQRGAYSPGINVVPAGTVIEPDGSTTTMSMATSTSTSTTSPTIDTSNVMTSVWDTRLSTDANYNTANYATPNMVPCTTISVPLAQAVNATINWGDGTPDTVVNSSYNSTAITHTYSDTPGLHTVKVTGTFAAWVGSDWINWTQGCVTSVTSWGDATGTSDGTAGFNGSVNLTDVARIPSTMSLINNFLSANSATFTGASLSKWDVSNVTQMDGMFADMKGITGDISGWNTSNVQSMESIFAGSTFNGDISKWDVRNVIWFNLAFDSSSFNGDITKWQLNSVSRMSMAFNNATAFNQDLSGWTIASGVQHDGFGQGSGLTANHMPLFQ